MNWIYESLGQEHQLVFQKSILARIVISFTKKGKFVAITMISGIYFSAKTQERLEKEKKEWVAYRKKFKTKSDANEYVKRKKEVVLKFIKSREKEA